MIGKLAALLAGLAVAALTPCLHATETNTAASKTGDMSQPRIEVCFVLDSTGSMGGLIEGAKQKIWSIANTIISRKPTPLVKLGLITYRDRGDEYVTRRFDLTDDIDEVFNNLQTFRAGGGGDGPESVNEALDMAVNRMSWSTNTKAYKVVFLVGDFPPHMDYADDVKYAVTCETAVKNDLIINTIQCGNNQEAAEAWADIARRAEGAYVAISQSGSMALIDTPFDKDIARLNTELAGTVLAYGSKSQKDSVARKTAAAAAAPAAVTADRALYNLKTEGKAVQGEGDLLSDMREKGLSLEVMTTEELPAEMQAIPEGERAAYLAKKQKDRESVNAQLSALSRKRTEYIAAENKRMAVAGKGESFDAKVADTINSQADKKR
ncbi:MAG: vWA domain-containing protein [bacterium]